MQTNYIKLTKKKTEKRASKLNGMFDFQTLDSYNTGFRGAEINNKFFGS